MAKRDKLRRLKARATERESTSPPWTPFPGPQTLAYESLADITGYGGSAGGGKSDLLVGLATTRHLRSLLLRREGAQTRGLIDRAREILGNVGRLNEQFGIWRDLPGGRQIEFDGVKDPGDEQKHKGRPKDFIGIDEGDQFPEAVVRFLLGWLRTSVPGQRCRAVIGFNPPTSAEGRWVLAYFAPWLDKKHPKPALPGELRWYAMIKGVDTDVGDNRRFVIEGDERVYDFDPSKYKPTDIIRPQSRTFFPARVDDNPVYMETGYVGTLQALPEPLRSQLLYGDMAAGITDDPWQVIPTAWVQAAQARWTAEGGLGKRLSSIGMDVARGGRDRTVLTLRRGNWFSEQIIYPGKETPDGPSAIAKVVPLIEGHATINIDVIGIGSSAYDFAVQQNLNAVPMHAAEASEATDKSGQLSFFNKRAEWWWDLREGLDPNSGENLALPPDPELLADLTAFKWRLTRIGIQIESKEDVIKRIKRSPDKGDSIVYASAEVAAGIEGAVISGTLETANPDWAQVE